MHAVGKPRWKRSTKREAAVYRKVRACVRACSLGTINERIACASSPRSEGRSSSAPPLWKTVEARVVVYLYHACVHRLHRCTHVPRLQGVARFTKCLPDPSRPPTGDVCNYSNLPCHFSNSNLVKLCRNAYITSTFSNSINFKGQVSVKFKRFKNI